MTNEPCQGLTAAALSWHHYVPQGRLAGAGYTRQLEESGRRWAHEFFKKLKKRKFAKVNKGCVHIYIGKNWESLRTSYGMALRACGAGFSVGFYSFGQSVDDEIKGLESRLSNLQILPSIEQNLSQYNMIILHHCDLAICATLQNFLANKPQDAEVVLFGTIFEDSILAKADLISEIAMLEV